MLIFKSLERSSLITSLNLEQVSTFLFAIRVKYPSKNALPPLRLGRVRSEIKKPFQ